MVKNQPIRHGLVLIALLLISGCSQISLPQPGQVPEAAEPGLVSGGQFETDLRQKDGMPQVYLPGGTFLMGSSGDEVDAGIELCQRHYAPCNRWFYQQEYPQHEVSLSPFLIDQYEVSNQQYRRCVDQEACQAPLECKKGDPTFDDPDLGDHPVLCVDWQDAWDYCEWAGGRLPTEAEWEYAARGNEGRTFPWGDVFDGTDLNYCDRNCGQSHADTDFDDGFARTAPVGSYPAGISWAGIHDLGGNLSEWVGDWFGEYSPGLLEDPLGPDSGNKRVIKGCSWFFPPVYCRGANRGSAVPETRFDYLGFRCAADPLPEIDGVIEPGEWESAMMLISEDGSELYLQRVGDQLFLAIRSNPLELVSGNVFLAAGNQIRILHESAALGSAIYLPQGDSWVRTKDFEWCCRSTTDTGGARSMREAFYASDRWLGINSFNGVEGELEYLIELDGSALYLAVNITSAADPEQKQVWPVGIEDGPAAVLLGEFPEQMDFSPETWISLGEIP